MQRSGDLFALTLPDLSVAVMDPRTLQFFSLDEEGGCLADATQKDRSRAMNNLKLLGEFMEQPPPSPDKATTGLRRTARP
jgi:hypothetical protein